MPGAIVTRPRTDVIRTNNTETKEFLTGLQEANTMDNNQFGL